MPGFRFKLETVLRHRSRIEHERQRELAMAVAEYSRLKEQIRQLDESMQVSLAELRANHLIGPINLAYLTAHRRFVLSLHRQGAVLLTTLQEHDTKVNTARGALAEATRDRKVMDKLRENQQANWRAAEAHREAADLDEVAMQMSFEQQTEPLAGDGAAEVPS